MSQNLVRIGFANKSGTINKAVCEDNLKNILKISKKTAFQRIDMRPHNITDADYGAYAKMVLNKKTEFELQELLGLNSYSKDNQINQKIKTNQSKIKDIKDEVQLLSLITVDITLEKFKSMTSCPQHEAKEYLDQFNNDVDQGVDAFKKRKQIISKFSVKHSMSYDEAKRLLKENQFNASLFE